MHVASTEPSHTPPLHASLSQTILTGIIGAADRKSFDVALLDAFARASYLELDYSNEAANLERFEKELVPRLNGQVRTLYLLHRTLCLLHLTLYIVLLPMPSSHDGANPSHRCTCRAAIRS